MNKQKIFPNQTEDELIDKIKGGEPALFEILIRRYNPVLYKIARSYGFGHHDAEDLLQEAHVSAYTNLASFGFRSTYKTWVSRIMINKCLYKKQHAAGHREHANEDINENAQPMFSTQKQEQVDSQLLKKEFAALLENSLQQIPLPYRTVFILREVEGFSVNEASELLNITPVNVKVRLNRAKAMLQKQLEQFYITADIYSFHLKYCDAIVRRVFEQIEKNES